MMERQATRTFKTVLKNLRKEQNLSLQELGMRIESDASHIFKIENGQDITLSTMLRLAESLGVKVQFGEQIIVADKKQRKRTRQKS